MRASVVFVLMLSAVALLQKVAIAQPVVRPIAKPMYIGGKTAQDQQTATEIAKLASVEILAGQSSRSNFKIGASGGLRGYSVRVYGITEVAEQDRIVQFLEENAKKNKWKPIYISFAEKENLVPEVGGYRRAGEVLM